jgi:hypothetical protein
VQVNLGGRIGEMTVMGAANMTTCGSSDMMHANALARTMIFKFGWSPVVGPVNIVDENEDMPSGQSEALLGNMSPTMAAAGLREMERLMKAAEAKAYFGLVCNWELLSAMVDALMTKESHVLKLCVLSSTTLRCSCRTFCYGAVGVAQPVRPKHGQASSRFGKFVFRLLLLEATFRMPPASTFGVYALQHAPVLSARGVHRKCPTQRVPISRVLW